MSAAWIVVAALLAQSEAEREAEMFGPSEEPSAERREPTTEDRGPTTEDREPRTDLGAGIAEALVVRNDVLDIGGQLFMRGELSIDEDTPARQWTLASPTLLDVYFDARPSDRVRLYARGRLTHVMSFGGVESLQDVVGSGVGTGAITGLAEPTSTDLDQLWVKLDVERQLYVTAGRQQVRWGSGRFWNPTDFLNVRARDPLAVFDERLGVGMLRLHYPLESLGWNFYAIGIFEGARRADQIGGAARAEILVGTTEIAVSGAARTGEPLQLGVDVSSGVWLFDLRAEAALRHGVTEVFRRGPFDINGPEADLVAFLLREESTVREREDEWLAQVMVGAELSINYSEEDSVLVGVEGFYNQAGYDSARYYPLMMFVDGTFRPLYNGRFYAGAYVLLAAPGDWNRTVFTLSGLGNLSDRSYLGRFDVAATVLTYLRVNAFTSLSFGRNGELHYGIDVDPDAPILPLLPEQLRPIVAAGLAQPVLDVGVGLTLSF